MSVNSLVFTTDAYKSESYMWEDIARFLSTLMANEYIESKKDFYVVSMTLKNSQLLKESKGYHETIEYIEETEDSAIEETEGETYNTIFTRLWEYVNEHKTTIVAAAGDIAIIVYAIATKISTKKDNTLIKQVVSSIKGDTETTNDSQTSVVGAVNNMIDGYNSLKTTYEKYGETEADRNRIIGTLVVQNAAMLEMLVAVHVNNKNLPQGVKDLVTLKYANCLKALDDDEQLKAIVTDIRAKISASSEEATETEV